jgi:hypothetical protein
LTIVEAFAVDVPESARPVTSHQSIGLDEPHFGIATGGTGIGYPIADFQITHILPDRLDGPGAFDTRNKGKRLRVVARAVINIDVVEARRRLAQAHLTRPGLIDLDRCPVQNLGAASLPNLNRMRHQGFLKSIKSLLFIRENRQFHKFIILTMILTSPHDSAVRSEEVLRVL